MVDEKLLERLRAIGIKSVSFTYTREMDGVMKCDGIGAVEFFPLPAIAPLVEPGRFDADTLIPPEPESGPESVSPPRMQVAPALAALLNKGSVS